jgi:methylmalonyl-CoA mutase N-terminal domain/subunit
VIEAGANEYFKRIEEEGGVLAGIEKGFFMKEIADAAYRFQQKLDSGEFIFVGLNGFTEEAPGSKIEILKIGKEFGERQTQRLQELRSTRDNEKVAQTLSNLEGGLRRGENSFPLLLEACKAYATLGEICDVMRSIWGQYRESSII